MPRRFTINISATADVFGLVAEAGKEPWPLLERAGLADYDLSDPDGRVPYRRHLEFLGLAAQSLEDEDVGLALAQRGTPRDLDLLGHLVLNCRTFGDALREVVRYQALLARGPTIGLAIRAAARLTYVTNLAVPASRFQEQAALGRALWIGRQLTRSKWHPLSVSFTFPKPSRASRYRDFFGCPVGFGRATTEMQITASDLGLVIPGADARLARHLKVAAEALLSRSPEEESLTERVRGALSERLESGDHSFAAIARHLAMSGRTLHRRLAAEATSFQAVLSDFRRDQSQRYLAERRLSLAEIACVLGFSETSAFSRAFKRWTGTTPGQYRAAS